MLARASSPCKNSIDTQDKMLAERPLVAISIDIVEWPSKSGWKAAKWVALRK